MLRACDIVYVGLHKLLMFLISYFEFSKLSSIILPDQIKCCNLRARWSAFAEFNHRFHSRFLAFKNCFHSAVPAVADPAFHVSAVGFMFCSGPEEYALHSATYGYVGSNVHGSNREKYVKIPFGTG